MPNKESAITVTSNLTNPVPAIEAQELKKIYHTPLRKDVCALDGISLRVERGTIFGLIGQNGAGKTTLVKILLGLSKSTAGFSRLLGGLPGDPVSRGQVGYLPEQMRIPEHFKAEGFLRYMGKLSRVDSVSLTRRIPELLEKVGLAGISKPVKNYSKGMQQRLGLAQALINEPQILILDEPTDGLDPLGRKEVRDLLVSLRAANKTIFLNSHLLSEIELVCDQIMILDQGKVARLATPSELTRRSGEYLIRVLKVNDAVRAAAASAIGDGPSIWQETTLRCTPRDLTHLNSILDSLRKAPIEIVSVEPVKASLEQVFLRVVDGKEG